MIRYNLLNSFSRRFYYLKPGVYGYAGRRETFVNYDVVFPVVSENDNAINSLINGFRTHGYKAAKLDPLGLRIQDYEIPELNPSNYGLTNENKEYNIGSLSGSESSQTGTVSSVVDRLKKSYCGLVAAEYMHISEWKERVWFAENFESLHEVTFSDSEKLKFAELMLKCQNFDHYLALKFSTIKRYGGEGAEAMMAFFWETFLQCSQYNLQQVILCMAHRGRLNLLTLLLNFPPVLMFRKMRGKAEFPSEVKGSGDVLSHFVSSTDLSLPNAARPLHVSMLPNPSHLEAINASAVGKSRARQQSLGLGDYGHGQNIKPSDGVLCVQIHGDGAFSGQGIVPETLALSQTPNFRVGGSIHFITNNQIGYTAEADIARSSRHTSDLAKAIDCPVIHVNGDHPEMVAKAARLALAYRQTFCKDIFINFICFRRWGHNEMDDPSFTQPIMYDVIGGRKSSPDRYADQLMTEGILTEEQRTLFVKEHNDEMTENFKKIDSTPAKAVHLSNQWKNIKQAPGSIDIWDTGVDTNLLKFVGAKSVETPDNLTVHEHLKRTHCDARLKRLQDGTNIDWSTAEAMAIGSLLYQGYSVRISGQDVGRGTFSQRHAMLIHRKTDESYIPLNHIDLKNQKAFFEISNSLLSEEAVLGFEYGMSIESPNRLVIWEAQFGDFFNGAQIIIDTLVTSGEAKWLTQSGLVMLLPHGYDGMGPEHSSSRPERFLQLCDSKETCIDGDDVNISIVNPTTSAQYFHLLRRQMIRNYRKPLIVMSPKLLLRHPAAACNLNEMAPGTHFLPVIGEKKLIPEQVTKVILCSGKHCYALEKQRETKELKDYAIVRLESLCPFPANHIRTELNRFPNATKFIWSQEEPRNMGYWSFVKPRFENLLGIQLSYAGRPELPIVATAIGEFHQKEVENVMKSTFA